MKKIYLSAIFLFCFLMSLVAQDTSMNLEIVSSDIDHFWEAYDQITATDDSLKQYELLKELFLDKGSPGLAALRQARNYRPESYMQAILDYPLFWASIRENTYQAKTYAKELTAAINKLKKQYPDLKPAKIYFSMGALRTNGTIMNGMVLIGSELAFSDSNTVSKELPPRFDYLRNYFDQNPKSNIVFLNLHEFVHTQQSALIEPSLLYQCLQEGVAELVAELTLDTPSPIPAIAFGEKNEARVKAAFTREIFSPFYDNWLWNDFHNQFQMRDLGYYVGYAICKKYYENAKDKKAALARMIELDYANPQMLDKFVDESQYFEQSVPTYRGQYEKSRPEITQIKPLSNNSKNVKAGKHIITLTFSKKMDPSRTSFELGPSGMETLMRVQRFIGFSEDAKSVQFEVKLEKNKSYELLVDFGFRSEDGIPLKPYLIKFETGE